MNPIVGSVLMMGIVVAMAGGTYLDLADDTQPPEKIISRSYANLQGETIKFTLAHSNVDLSPSFTKIRIESDNHKAAISLNDTLASGESLFLPCLEDGKHLLTVSGGSQLVADLTIRCYSGMYNASQDDSEGDTDSYDGYEKCNDLQANKFVICVTPLLEPFEGN